jgi:hypothetical protein
MPCIEKCCPGSWTSRPGWKWVLLNTICFYILSAAICFGCTFIPSTDTKNNGFRLFFYRGDDVLNTTYLCWSKLAYYFLMNIVGHFFVNQSNMNFYRKSWIMTNSSKYRDFCCVPLLAPIFWFLSANMILRAPEDLDATTPGYRYPWYNCFMYNLFAWTTAYYVGLQFTHFDKGIMTQFVLKPEKIKKWPLTLWIIAAVIGCLALAIVGYMIYAYVRAGVWYWYIAWTALVLLTFVLITVIFRKHYSLHMHHYTVGMIVIVLIGYQSIPASLVMGFCNGMMIEGGSRWGYDPIWVKKKAPAPKPAEGAAEAEQSAANLNGAANTEPAQAEMNQIQPEPTPPAGNGEKLEEL